MTEYSFKEFMDYVNNSEHRHLIEENGLIRLETDEEFKQRLIAKLKEK